MPQLFQVLKCYKCNVFQVHQTKKANKFVCKMCGEKQSIKRHYGIGNGQECRGHVQKLNAMRGVLIETKITEDNFTSEGEEFEGPSIELAQKKSSKWSEFVDNNEETKTTDESDNTVFLENQEVVLEIPKKKRHKQSNNNQECHTVPKKTYKMASREICLGIQEYDIEANVKCKEPDTENTKQTQFKYGTLQEETKIDVFSAIRKSQTDCDNFHTIDISTIPIENNSEKLDTCKSNKVKFIPPVINANSKWAKFTEWENDQEEISGAQSMPSNVHESQCNITVNNTDISNYNEKKLVPSINLQQSNWTALPTELKGIEHERNNFTKTITKSYCINSNNKSNQKHLNRKEFSTVRNDLVEYSHIIKSKSIELDHNNMEQKSKGNPKGLFALCDDDEIDSFLDI